MRLPQIQEIPYSSEYYPAEWRKLKDAPQCAYAVGNVGLLKKRKFTVVGSRRTPVSALKLGKEICKELSQAFVVATGLADGGDGAAIDGALQGSGEVICVLAGGFSALPQTHPAQIERIVERGLLLSPHSFDTPVRSFSYEYRNKLLASLGEGTLVLGAAEKSGALITAKYAREAGDPVFALPYTPGAACGAGCNALLKRGGILTESFADIAAYFSINVTERKQTVPLTADEEKLLVALREEPEAHISALSARSGVPVFKARSVISSLEVKGLVVALGGNRYTPV